MHHTTGDHSAAWRATAVAAGAAWTLLCPCSAAARSYTFDGTIPRDVLESYLSRAVTMMDLLTGRGDPEDNVRMLTETGAKFAGRTIYLWGGESHLPAKLEAARTIEPKLHAADPEMILQAGVFEIVTRDVANVAVPSWVFEEFDLPAETRGFRYEDMLYADGRLVDHWSDGASVPDISRLETRMWFYYLSVCYIDVGCEAIHFGQAELMGRADPERVHWWDLLSRVRRYAAANASRHMVLCDAHVPSGGMVFDGNRLLFDLHSFPLRIEEVDERPQEGILKVGYLDSMFGRSMGGVTPSGWTCDSLPYLAELDNFGSSGRGGENIGAHWIWGYDEICWFAHQGGAYRGEWLRYAWGWIREHDSNGFLQMPGSRCLADAVTLPDGEKLSWYHANRQSDATPHGFGDEEAVRAIWEADD